MCANDVQLLRAASAAKFQGHDKLFQASVLKKILRRQKDEDGSSLLHGIRNLLIAAFMLVPAAQQRLVLQPLLEMPRKLERTIVLVTAAHEYAVAL